MLEQPVCDKGYTCKLISVGGGSASPVTVSTCAALTTAVQSESPAVVRIATTISNCGVIDVESNKSIVGVGSTGYPFYLTTYQLIYVVALLAEASVSERPPTLSSATSSLEFRKKRTILLLSTSLLMFG